MTAGEQVQGIPNNPAYRVSPQFAGQTMLVSGACTLLGGGVVEITKAGVCAITLAAPAQDGVQLAFSSKTAQAHTITITAGLHGLGASEDVLTFGGAIDDGCILQSLNGAWMVVATNNVTAA